MNNETRAMTEDLRFIDGAWQAGERDATFTSVDPSIEGPIAAVARGTAEDFDSVVSAAALAITGPWSTLTPAERVRLGL